VVAGLGGSSVALGLSVDVTDPASVDGAVALAQVSLPKRVSKAPLASPSLSFRVPISRPTTPRTSAVPLSVSPTPPPQLPRRPADVDRPAASRRLAAAARRSQLQASCRSTSSPPVGSAWGAVPGCSRSVSPDRPPEPDVRLSPHPALHEPQWFDESCPVLDHGVGIWEPRNRYRKTGTEAGLKSVIPSCSGSHPFRV
jgi:hypothetical protein